MRVGSHPLRRTLCAVLLAASAGQFAQAAEPGFYVGVAAGQSDYDVGAGEAINVLINSPFGGSVFSVPPESTQVEDGGVSWSAIVGYRIHTYVAAELAYMSFAEGDVTETFRVTGFGPLGPPSITLTQRTRVTVQGPALSLLGILPLGAGWEVYLRGGVLFADQELESIYPSGAEAMTLGSEEWLAGGGLRYTFAERWGLRLEYQRIDTIDSSFRLGETDLDQLSLTATFAL